MSEFSPCVQVKVPAAGPIVDRGAARGSALEPLGRLRQDHTPSSGFYYCNEKLGLYIVSRADHAAGLVLRYVDLKRPSTSRGDKERIFEVRPKTNNQPKEKSL